MYNILLQISREDPEIVMAILGLVVLLIVGLLGGITGLIVTLYRISKDEKLVELSRESYLKSSEQQRALIDLVGTVLNIAEQVYVTNHPTGDLARAIDYAEDVLDQIRGEVDVDVVTEGE